MEPERGEALGEWGGGGREGEGGSVASRIRALITRKEVSRACVCCGVLFCFCFLCLFVCFLPCICFFYLFRKRHTTVVIGITAAAAAIISEENRMQSCHARRTVQHLNNHPRGR